MPIALTRAVSPNLHSCELTHLARDPIDVRLAASQHSAYVGELERLGCTIVELEPLPSMPDSVFVEDTAIVFDELAVITRPGADSRRGEVPSVAAVLQRYRRLVTIAEPGTLDGGDVLVSGRRVFVGRSSRSNDDAVTQLRSAVEPHGYDVTPVAVDGCLHLKTAVTEVADGVLLVNPSWSDTKAFGAAGLIEVDPEEPFAANTVRIGSKLLHGAAFPRTRKRLEDAGLEVTSVDLSELAKAEGAVSCCSLIVRG